jgi:hypothetical protein
LGGRFANNEKGKISMPLNFYYCKGDGFHAVIEEQNEKFATEYFVYLMNELLEPEKGISEKDVVCEPVNIYEYKRRPTPHALDGGYCACPPSVPRYDAGDGWKCHWCNRPRK